MKPQVVAWELGKRLPHDAIVSSDSGTITTWWARQIPVKRGQLHSCSGNLATMACGVPYAMAASIAYPGRPCIAFIGDGVATYKLPERLELFTQFPFTPTGKIQRHALVRDVVTRISAAS